MWRICIGMDDASLFAVHVAPLLDDVSLLATATVARKHPWSRAARHHAARWRRPRRPRRALRAKLYRRARTVPAPGVPGPGHVRVLTNRETGDRSVVALPVCCKHDIV